MIEIIILPYMAISFAIGWTVFSPFFPLDDLDSLSFARLELIDLFAAFLPVGLLLSLALKLIPKAVLMPFVMIVITTAALLFAAFSLAIGLFLLKKMPKTTTLRRMMINGIVVPVGSLLTLAWIAIPIYASAFSVVYAVPAIIVVGLLTLLLRSISNWICNKALLAF